MITEGRYTLGELNAILMESTNEFKPKVGDGVEREDKRNNGKAVDDIMKDTTKNSGGSAENKTNENKEDIQDGNKTTLDVKFSAEPDKSYKDRVKAQVHGYPSADNEKNSKVEEENKSLDFDGNKDFYDKQSDKSKKLNDAEAKDKHAGLKSRMYPESNFKNDTLFKENKTIKRLHFRNSVFLSEAQMLKKVPEEFRSKSGRFIMKDSNDTEYLVECDYNDKFKVGQLRVLGKTNKKQINEELERMKSLYSYDSARYEGKTTTSSRINESRGLSKGIDLIRNIEKNGIKK